LSENKEQGAGNREKPTMWACPIVREEEQGAGSKETTNNGACPIA
jgi:hypothetical protein